jgi:ABC-type cobalamin/Fe3+-siderophores transport system ATPase subunit
MDIIDKYKPKTVSDFLDYGDTVSNIIQTLNQNTKIIIVIAGPCGCGKTTIIDYILDICKYKELTIDSHFVKSSKNFRETLLNTQFTFYVKTCIVFPDFEFIINDNIYNNPIKSALSKLPHNVIFSINEDYLKKFQQNFSELKPCIFELKSLSTTNIRKLLNKIAKNESIKVTRDKINKCISHLPDIRKVIQNLVCSNDKNIQFTHTSQTISYLINNKTISNIGSLDMFVLIPMIHESYIKYSKKNGILDLSAVIAYCDIIHTNSYKTRTSTSCEAGIIFLFLNIFQYFTNKKFDYVDFPSGKILSKMSNRQTKIQTFAKLKSNYNCVTNEQLYLCKCLNTKTCKLLDNQFL